MMPGGLYLFEQDDVEPLFCEVQQDNIIQNHKYWDEQIFIAKGDVIMFVERLDLTPTTATESTAGTAAAVAMRPAHAIPPCGAAPGSEEDWKEVSNLWDKNKRIPGSIFLHPSAKLIWVSYIDLKYFKKVEKK